ncbi:TetR/AcrR family transcriptional regulator [Roseibium aggregatum]|uniref:TetR family transcriptional regulator n=1 Tax=Roseibium aggregatum TaxID=187304 RepID=A0A939EKU7_9HYPH|nr:TetR/AcrR family transcriptional regulator [Roseibium aggregatum]MBN9673510.1 TetR family transcriptional regulator [Roseibium aggregatum]
MSMSGTQAPDKGSPRAGWKQDPEGVRANILAIALEEFSTNGLSGARMDEIAAKTKTSKRMIYYYFGDKESLYLKALEAAYRKVRQGEEELALDHLPPKDALERLVEFTFDHHRNNPAFIRLVMIENIHHGRYLEQSDEIKSLNRAAISKIETLYSRGVADGVFRMGIEPLRIHWLISAMSFFNVSNAMTFSMLFGPELQTADGQGALRGDVREAVLRFVAV